MFRINILGYGCIYDSSLVDDKNRYLKSPSLKQSANTAGTLTFTIGPAMDGVMQLELLKNTIYVEQYDRVKKDYDIIWAGRVLENSLSDYNDREIECEGALAYLNDSLQPASFSKVYGLSYKQHFISMIKFHNAMMTSGNRKFDVSKIETSYASYLDKIDNILFPQEGVDSLYVDQTRSPEESTLDLITSQFLEKWGGYLKITYSLENGNIINYLDYIDAYDEVSNEKVTQPIEFEKNLVSITRTASADDFATALYPLGDSLDDVNKSYIEYEHNKNQNGKYIYYDGYGNVVSDSNSYITSTRIDPETGGFVAVNDSKYTVLSFIPVIPGERYFLTSYLYGIPLSLQSKDNDGKTPIGSALYVVHKADYQTAVTIGDNVQNMVDRDTEAETQVDKVFEDYEITIPEDGVLLSVAIYDPDHLAKPFVLKHFNPSYAEERWSIMSVPADFTGTIIKPEAYPYGRDIYPADCGYSNTERYFRSRTIYYPDLIGEFGFIIKPASFEGINNPEFLFKQAKAALLRMTEKIQLEVKAVDLSFLPEYDGLDYHPFRLLDMVQIVSPPHKLTDKALPILDLEISFDSPEDSTYTLSNEVDTRDGTPSYMTVYMSDMYKKGG